MHDRNKGLIAIHLAAFLFGFSGLFGKFISLNPVAIVFGRTFFAGTVFLVGLALLKKPHSGSFGQRLSHTVSFRSHTGYSLVYVFPVHSGIYRGHRIANILHVPFVCHVYGTRAV